MQARRVIVCRMSVIHAHPSPVVPAKTPRALALAAPRFRRGCAPRSRGTPDRRARPGPLPVCRQACALPPMTTRPTCWTLRRAAGSRSAVPRTPECPAFTLPCHGSGRYVPQAISAPFACEPASNLSRWRQRPWPARPAAVAYIFLWIQTEPAASAVVLLHRLAATE